MLAQMLRVAHELHPVRARAPVGMRGDRPSVGSLRCAQGRLAPESKRATAGLLMSPASRSCREEPLRMTRLKREPLELSARKPRFEFRCRPKTENLAHIERVMKACALVVQHHIICARYAHNVVHAGRAEK